MLFDKKNNYRRRRKTKTKSLTDLENKWCTTKIKLKPKKEVNKKLGNNLYKTEICQTFEEFGFCKYGNKCQYAHGYDELRIKPEVKLPKAYKTVKCKNYWGKNSICPYGDKCKFVHEVAIGFNDKVAKKKSKHNKYRTVECETYKKTGTCPYGDNCAFIHKKEEELKTPIKLNIKRLDSNEDFEKNSRFHLWTNKCL